MSGHDILITGTPRSGTTLTCHLLNKVPDTLALHEPMRAKQLAEVDDPAARVAIVAQFCAEQRRMALAEGRVISKNVDGRVPDNPIGTEMTSAGLRKSVVRKGYIPVTKPLSEDFALVIKHNSGFTAILGALVERFPVYAVIRNPLATLGSWSTVSFQAHDGRAPAGERLSPELLQRLEGINSVLDRQIALLDWFHEQFLRYLPADRIIKYEDIVSSGGKRLVVVRAGAANLDEPLTERNLSDLYDQDQQIRIASRLLSADGAFWTTYDRNSVISLLDTLPSSSASIEAR
jgi:hypothetical protein